MQLGNTEFSSRWLSVEGPDVGNSTGFFTVMELENRVQWRRRWKLEGILDTHGVGEESAVEDK